MPRMGGERFEVDGLVGERWDGDGTPVVLLHAGVADRRVWRDVVPHLDAPVVAYDRRGFGETPPGPEGFTHLADLLGMLDAAVDGPAWLVGNSMGGALALDAAVTVPDRIAGLVLIAPAVSGQPEPEEWDEQMRRGMAAYEAAHGPDEVLRLEAQWWLDGPDEPEGRVGGAARELAVEMNRQIIANGVPEGAGEADVDAWSRLGELAMPVTILCGDSDERFAQETCAALAERIPGARHEVLPGVAHLPSLEIPEELAARIQASTSGR
jgi:pimeloyl-ACP methyl ester carboxylesterase